jgi:hypothetical protein
MLCHNPLDSYIYSIHVHYAFMLRTRKKRSNQKKKVYERNFVFMCDAKIINAN